MVKQSNIELLIKAINATENLNGREFNKHPDALNAYVQLFGKAKYEEVINSKKYADYNKFYSPTWCFKKEIEQQNIPSNKIKGFIDKIIHQPCKNQMLIYLIKLSLSRGELNLALSFTGDLCDEKYESKYHGYRQILEHFAVNPDLNEFKKYLKLSKPGKAPRSDISNSKSKFISNCSKINGIEKGIELLDNKIFGWKYCYSVIENTADKYSLEEIEGIINKFPKFEEQDEYIKQWFYVRHYSNKKPTVIPETDFEVILKDVLTIDKSIKRGDGRYRDYLLYDLGSAVENLDQVKSCKKNIIAPFYKRELNYHIKNIKEKAKGNKR